MKHQYILFMLLLITLCGCQPEPTSIVSPSPVVPTYTSLPRWMIYEKALSKAIVNKEDGLCEWEILGNSGNEVYVWALCMVRGPIRTAGSGPAVIQLGQDGEIEKVILPRDGNYYNQDIQLLFPAEIQGKGLSFSPFNGVEAENHIDERLKTNGPPLIVISGVPLP
jgi:hypothetical protein